MKHLRQYIRSILLAEQTKPTILRHDKIDPYIIEMVATDNRRHPFKVSTILLNKRLYRNHPKWSISSAIDFLTKPGEEERSFASRERANRYYDAMVTTFRNLASKQARRFRK